MGWDGPVRPEMLTSRNPAIIRSKICTLVSNAQMFPLFPLFPQFRGRGDAHANSWSGVTDHGTFIPPRGARMVMAKEGISACLGMRSYWGNAARCGIPS